MRAVNRIELMEPAAAAALDDIATVSAYRSEHSKLVFGLTQELLCSAEE